jgi:hypothetical protein
MPRRIRNRALSCTDLRIASAKIGLKALGSAMIVSETTITHSVQANRAQLIIACEALKALIEDRLASLRNERPNSTPSREKRDLAIKYLTRFRDETISLREAIVAAPKNKVEKPVVSFEDGLKRWWTNDHENICSRGFDLGMLLTAVNSMIASRD